MIVKHYKGNLRSKKEISLINMDVNFSVSKNVGGVLILKLHQT